MFEAVIEGYRWFFLRLADAVGLGWGIVALSAICSALMVPLMRLVAGVVSREAEYQSVILPQIAEIKRRHSDDADRHAHILRLYRRYGYSPLSAVKKVLPLFVQIPFLLLTYFMLKGTPQLNGVGFLFLRDLGAPDALLKTVGLVPVGLNVLPIVMTGVNLLTVAATPGFTGRDRLQAVGISLLFLALLYTAPSALLLYWTLNNVITMVRTLVARRGEGARLLLARVVSLRNVPSAIRRAATPRAMSYASLGLLVVALYMRLMVKMEVWWFNYMASYWLMNLVLAALVWASYFAIRPKTGAGRAAWKLVLSSAAVVAVALVAVDGSIAFTFKLFMYVTSSVDLSVVFDILFAAWVVAAAVELRAEFRASLGEVASSFRENGVWLVLPVALAVHYSFSSADFRLPAGSVATLAVYMLAPVALAAAFSVWAFRRNASGSAVFRLVAGACVGAYLVPMVSHESGKMLGYCSNIVVRFCLMAAVAMLLFFIRRRRTATVFVSLLSAAVLVNVACVKLSAARESGERQEAAATGVEAAFASLRCARTNNVYLLVYDSYSHDIVLDALKIPHANLAKDLPARGFTRYEAYSLGDNTIPGMASAFSLGGVVKGSGRSMLAGNNVFCDCLKRSGYRTSYVLCGYDMPNRGERMPGDFYFPTPQKVTRPEMVLYPCILRGLLSQSANTFNDYTREEWLAVKRRLVDEAPKARSFIYAHSAVPGHAVASPIYRKSDEEEQKAFAARIALADAELKEDLDQIFASDVDPLIIVASDHGAYLTIPKGGVGTFSAFDLLDRCGIQLFVRWPAGYKPVLDIHAFPDVFLEALICLTGDESLVRFKSGGETRPFQYPLKAPAGTVKDSVVRVGQDEGRNLFEAAKAAAGQH